MEAMLLRAQITVSQRSALIRNSGEDRRSEHPHVILTGRVAALV
jgi:hypothetical protein